MSLMKLGPAIGEGDTSLAADEVSVSAYHDAIAVSRVAVSSRRVWQTSADVTPAYGFARDWHHQFVTRVGELAARQPNWDSYDGAALASPAVTAMAKTLTSIDRFLGIGPQVSLTGVGGLLCEWSCADVTLELEASPDGELSVYYADPSSDVEEDCPLASAYDIEKWAWQASSPV